MMSYLRARGLIVVTLGTKAPCSDHISLGFSGIPHDPLLMGSSRLRAT
jgi:hypothetical protein